MVNDIEHAKNITMHIVQRFLENLEEMFPPTNMSEHCHQKEGLIKGHIWLSTIPHN